MLKKIRVEELRVGMFLKEFCCSWMEHPFWRSGFVVTDERDIERIRDSRITEVWIDASRGLDIEPDRAAQSEHESEARIDAEFEAIARAEDAAGVTARGDAYGAAAAICADGKAVVRRLFAEARLGRAIDVTGAREFVDRVIDELADRGDALVHLTRIKEASDYTYQHSLAVCVLMVALAHRLGLSRAQRAEAGLAGLLHDFGKVAIPLDLLHKPGRLNDEEFEIMRRHPEEGVRILQACGINGAALEVCRDHHARIDGEGYPRGLAGGAIGRFARMAAVCDVYDAITSGRPYKQAWDPAESMRRMAEWQIGQFDPVCFHAFVKVIGIYPVGSLVRLASNRLGVVIGQSAHSLLEPQVRAFYSLRQEARIEPVVIDLADRACGDRIEAREDPAKWNFPDLFTLWSGLGPGSAAGASKTQ